MSDQWRAVPDFPGYEVSRFGDVRCADRAVKLNKTRRGALNVNLRDEGGRWRTFSLAHVVCSAFYGARPRGFEARFLDENLANVAVENLRWDKKGMNRRGKARNQHSAKTSASGARQLENVEYGAKVLMARAARDAARKLASLRRRMEKIAQSEDLK